MNIEYLIPYAKNARHNAKAVPVVAESIKEFGLRGQIILESKESPVIVTGHTRVLACKSLGWTEIPDENIAYCDGLTEEQIKAFRIADNKTAEVATWNIALLKSELKGIKKLDMSKFKCVTVPKAIAYGAERLRTDRVYHLEMSNRETCNKQGYPQLQRCFSIPDELIGFNYAKTLSADEKKNKGCHFFIDDYQFERIWAAPDNYTNVLKGFKCVLTPDFSLYLDMPQPMQAWNHYRSQVIGQFLQAQGLHVIPTLSWATPDTFAFCFEGIPKHSIVAVSSVGVKSTQEQLSIWRCGMEEAIKRLQPRCILLYGGRIDFDFGQIQVIEYKNSVTERLKHGR